MAEQIISKQCYNCKEIKPISEFHKNSITIDGFSHYCKICKSTKDKRYNESEEGKAIRQSYRATGARRESIWKYRQSPKGKITRSKSMKVFQLKHPERRKAKTAVKIAIKKGQLISPCLLLCSSCKKPAQLYHHPSYESEHWLDVIPVCLPCHNNVGKE